MQQNDLETRFAYHQPTSEAVAARHQGVRDRCFELAAWINESIPDGREKSLAITHLEEVMFWANASVARTQLGKPDS